MLEQDLPFLDLANEITEVLRDPSVVVPSRLVHETQRGASLFAMPASDSRLSITKLITFVSDHPSRGLPAIQGDILIFSVSDGRRLAMMDGPSITARRTAAVSLLAARLLRPRLKAAPMLIVGVGVQGKAHLEAFQDGFDVNEVWIHSRTKANAQALAMHGEARGLKTRIVDDPNAALSQCPIVVSATNAQEVSLCAAPRSDAFIAAVGSFKPTMAEWSAQSIQRIAREGFVCVDTRDADHEAGDLIQAGLRVENYPCLQDFVLGKVGASEIGPVLFKSCGWAGWDLAAARQFLKKL